MGAGFQKEKEAVKCVVCKKGETKAGKATVTLERDGATLVFKGVPARVCANCGEEYVDGEITARLLKSAVAFFLFFLLPNISRLFYILCANNFGWVSRSGHTLVKKTRVTVWTLPIPSTEYRFVLRKRDGHTLLKTSPT
jgi:YgiT-type zinc finger domain-containing protein